MKEENKILGNEEERKGMRRLLRQAGEDKLIKRVLGEGEKPADDVEFFKQFKQCQKAWELIHAIRNSGYLDVEKGLYGQTMQSGKTRYYACDNISIALAYLAVGRIEDAEYLIMNVEKKIGLYKEYKGIGLVRTHEESGDLWDITDNALITLAYLGLDGKNRAMQQIETIEDEATWHNKDDYDWVLFGKDPCSRDNAAFALALGAIEPCYKSSASDYRKQIEQVIGYDDHAKIPTGLIMHSNGHSGIFTTDNALLALVQMSVEDNLDKASKLIKGIEKHIGFHENTKLAYKCQGSLHTTLADSALLALAYMMEEFYKTNQNE